LAPAFSLAFARSSFSSWARRSAFLVGAGLAAERVGCLVLAAALPVRRLRLSSWVARCAADAGRFWRAGASRTSPFDRGVIDLPVAVAVRFGVFACFAKF
jgi:hypothetical protein